jgi:hypothetical protein
MGVREWTGSGRGNIAGLCEHESTKLGLLPEISDNQRFEKGCSFRVSEG